MPKLRRAWRNVLQKLARSEEPLPQWQLPNGNGHCGTFWHALDKTLYEMEEAGAIYVTNPQETWRPTYAITLAGRALLEGPAHD